MKRRLGDLRLQDLDLALGAGFDGLLLLQRLQDSGFRVFRG